MNQQQTPQRQQLQPHLLSSSVEIAAFIRALPGAADALVATNHVSKDGDERALMLLQFLWLASASVSCDARFAKTTMLGDTDLAGRPLVQWERKLLAYLTRTATTFQPQPGHDSSRALFMGLLLVRLGWRAQRARGGVGSSGCGVWEMSRGVALLRGYAAESEDSCAKLVQQGAVPELVRLLELRHSSVSSAAAALLLALVADDQSAHDASEALPGP
jgi:hypothetical protein